MQKDQRSKGSTFGESVTRYNIIDFIAVLPMAVWIPFGIATPTKDENAVVHYLLYCFSALPQQLFGNVSRKASDSAPHK